jgi:hypothetical protein
MKNQLKTLDNKLVEFMSILTAEDVSIDTRWNVGWIAMKQMKPDLEACGFGDIDFCPIDEDYQSEVRRMHAVAYDIREDLRKLLLAIEKKE